DVGFRGVDLPGRRWAGAVTADRAAPVAPLTGRSRSRPALGPQPLVLHAGGRPGAGGLRAASTRAPLPLVAAARAENHAAYLCRERRDDRPGARDRSGRQPAQPAATR